MLTCACPPTPPKSSSTAGLERRSMTDTTSADISGEAEPLDFARMVRERIEKVRRAMDDAGVDLLVCCGQNNVAYLTGARVPAADAARAATWRSVATLRVDEP